MKIFSMPFLLLIGGALAIYYFMKKSSPATGTNTVVVTGGNAKAPNTMPGTTAYQQQTANPINTLINQFIPYIMPAVDNSQVSQAGTNVLYAGQDANPQALPSGVSPSDTTAGGGSVVDTLNTDLAYV